MGKKVLVTGGLGYVGSMLVPALLEKAYNVTVIDSKWFGNYIEPHKKLRIIEADIRGFDFSHLEYFDIAVHLANIANDPAVEMNPALSWEVNVLAGNQLITKLVEKKCPHFIFASSGSVYGIKTDKKVTEDLELVPISAYNKTKMIAERVFQSYSDKIRVHCIRPATICGWSPRMRLDVAVNLLTMQALKNREITVFGGEQKRPNINIRDMVRVYQHFIENPMLPSGFYNAGFENLRIIDIASFIANRLDAKITTSSSNDPRSYNQCSDKLLESGFTPKYNVEMAVEEMIEKYQAGELVDHPNWHTVSKMRDLGIK